MCRSNFGLIRGYPIQDPHLAFKVYSTLVYQPKGRVVIMSLGARTDRISLILLTLPEIATPTHALIPPPKEGHDSLSNLKILSNWLGSCKV